MTHNNEKGLPPGAIIGPIPWCICPGLSEASQDEEGPRHLDRCPMYRPIPPAEEQPR